MYTSSMYPNDNDDDDDDDNNEDVVLTLGIDSWIVVKYDEQWYRGIIMKTLLLKTKFLARDVKNLY